MFSVLPRNVVSNVIDVWWEKNVAVSFLADSTHGHFKNGHTIGPAHQVIKQRLPTPLFPQELVRRGLCWWYRDKAPRDTVLEGLEKIAREAKKGLWADPQSVPPWEWRKRK